jgi:hypothetical protein
MREEGMSLAAIAAELNARGERTRVYKTAWNPTQVARVLQRGERLRAEAAESSIPEKEV